jgi:hypothetical protein
MQFFHKFFIHNPLKDAPKKEIYVPSDSINFVTWYKNGINEGTKLHVVFGVVGSDYIVDGLPDILNNMVLNGLLFKCTAHRAVDGADMKKYSVWINPDNIGYLYESLEGSMCCFRSGDAVLIANKLPDVMRALLEHSKKYKERRKAQYAKGKE